MCVTYPNDICPFSKRMKRQKLAEQNFFILELCFSLSESRYFFHQFEFNTPNIINNHSFTFIFFPLAFLCKFCYPIAGYSGLRPKTLSGGNYRFEFIVDLVSPLGLRSSSKDCSIMTKDFCFGLGCSTLLGEDYAHPIILFSILY